MGQKRGEKGRTSLVHTLEMRYSFSQAAVTTVIFTAIFIDTTGRVEFGFRVDSGACRSRL